MPLAEDLRRPRAGAPSAARRRWLRLDLALALALVGGPALGLLGWLGLRQRVSDLEARLVRDANATFAAPRVRPAHAPAHPGTFGDAVARHLPAFQAEHAALKEDEPARELARAVVAGDRPYAELPPRYRDALARLRPALDGLLAGTRAERADLVPGAVESLPAPGTDWMGFQLAVLLAAVDVRAALADADPARAANRCLDGLALARDASVSAMLVGRMVGAAAVGRLAPPCASALAALPNGPRREAVAALRAIRAGIPPIAETMRHDFLAMELLTFGQALSPAARAALAPEAAVHVVDDPARRALWQRLFARDAWRPSRAVMDRELDAFALPPGAREAALKAAIELARRDPNPIPYIAAPDFSRYARRADAAALRLDALLLVAAAADHRDATGGWPLRIEALDGALPAEELARLAAVVEIRTDGPWLLVALTLPRGTDEDPATAVLQVLPWAVPPPHLR